MPSNTSSFRPLAAVKQLVVPAGAKPRRVLFGLFRGQILPIDMRSQLQLLLGLWEQETYKFVRQGAARCSWFIDVGAGRGELCMYFARQFPRVKIWAVEPRADDCYELQKNFSQNGLSLDAVTIVQKFISETGDGGTVRLDDLGVDPSARGFVKIDVDGAELDVLKSGSALLKPHSVDILIETHSLELERACADWLKARGFETSIIRNAWWRKIIPEYRAIPHNRWLWATAAR